MVITRKCGLSDDLSDAEALAIVEEEIRKIDTITLASELANGKFTSVNLAVKNAVKRICVKGAIKQANNVYIWVGGIALAIVLGYLIFK